MKTSFLRKALLIASMGLTASVVMAGEKPLKNDELFKGVYEEMSKAIDEALPSTLTVTCESANLSIQVMTDNNNIVNVDSITYKTRFIPYVFERDVDKVTLKFAVYRPIENEENVRTIVIPRYIGDPDDQCTSAFE